MFMMRLSKNRVKSNCKKLQGKRQAIADAIACQETFQLDYYKLEKGHAKQIQAISYTRPSSGICKGRQSTIVPMADNCITEVQLSDKYRQVLKHQTQSILVQTLTSAVN